MNETQQLPALAPYRQVRNGRRTRAKHCPSPLDVARFESGGLDEFHRAVISAHSHNCLRCGLSLAEIRQARNELLGATPAAQSLQSQRAAQDIATILRRRLH